MSEVGPGGEEEGRGGDAGWAVVILSTVRFSSAMAGNERAGESLLSVAIIMFA